MKKLSMQRRLAAEILGVGENKVFFDNLRIDDISQAITRTDIKELIKDKAIFKKISERQAKKERKGKRKGSGKFRRKVRTRKRDYILKIRNLRRYLSSVKGNGMPLEDYNYMRRLAKAGHFKTRKHLKEYYNDIYKKIKDEKNRLKEEFTKKQNKK